VKTNYLFTLCFCAYLLVYTGVAAQSTPLPKQWAYHYGGSDVDVAFVIKSTADGGAVVAGYTDSKEGENIGTCGFANLDKCGTLQWQQSFGGTGYAGNYNIDIYNDGLVSGVYFIRLQNKSLQKVINVVKMPL